MMILFKHVHFLNVHFGMKSNEEERLTFVSDEHPLKAKQSILMTEDGINISNKEVHLVKHPLLIVFKEGGIVIFLNDEQLIKAYLPNDSTDELSSNIISFKEEQFAKVLLLIIFKDEEIAICVNDEHFSKASGWQI